MGDRVELTGQLLSIALGPGLLGSIYDGLQIPLYKMAEENGLLPEARRANRAVRRGKAVAF